MSELNLPATTAVDSRKNKYNFKYCQTFTLPFNELMLPDTEYVLSPTQHNKHSSSNESGNIHNN